MRARWTMHVLEELRLLRSFRDLTVVGNSLAATFRARWVGSRAIHTAVPLELQVEPTNFCILNCICCGRARMTRKRGYMEREVFDAIVDDPSFPLVRRVHLFLHGEPLLHPDLVEMIRRIKAERVAVSLTTNGVLLDERKGAALLELGLERSDTISVSILGASRRTHESIMRGVDHRQVVDNLRRLLELRAEMNRNAPSIDVVFHTMAENQHEAPELARIWRGRADHVRVFPISESFAGVSNGGGNGYRATTCRFLWTRMTILWNGDVTRCMEDVDGRHVIGNIKHRTIAELWNSDELVDLKARHVSGRDFRDLGLCGRCGW